MRDICGVADQAITRLPWQLHFGAFGGIFLGFISETDVMILSWKEYRMLMYFYVIAFQCQCDDWKTLTDDLFFVKSQ